MLYKTPKEIMEEVSAFAEKLSKENKINLAITGWEWSWQKEHYTEEYWEKSRKENDLPF